MLMHSQGRENHFRLGLLWLIISEGMVFLLPAYMIICSLIQSQQLMSRTLLVDITSAGTSAFAECTLREIWWEFCKSFSILSLSLSLSAFAVKPADVRSQSFKSNVTVMVYAAITEAIKVPKWKIRSHLSSWEKYIVWRFLDSVFFFFFFPGHQRNVSAVSFITIPVASFHTAE